MEADIVGAGFRQIHGHMPRGAAERADDLVGAEEFAGMIVIGARCDFDAVAVARMFFIHAQQRNAMLDGKRHQGCNQVAGC